MNRAYSVLDVKSFDPSGRKFSGIATTPTTDRVGDVIEPLGVSFKNPLSLLLFHKSDLPVGTVKFGRPTAAGVPFDAEIPEVSEPGEVKNLTDKAAHFVKYGLIRAVSIGFRAVDDAVEVLKTGGLRFLKTEVLELSLVPIPANAEAVITTIKSIDAEYRPVSGASNGAEQVGRPGVTGAVVRLALKGASTTMTKSITEQISGFEATRQAKDAERKTLMNDAAEKGETLDTEQASKYDALAVEIKSIDEHLSRLREMEQENKAAAVPAVGGTTEQASASRAGQVISIKANRPAGIGMARVAIAKFLARLDGVTVKDVIAERWPDDSALKAYFQKATVPAGTTLDATWAGNLVDQTNLSSEFVEFLRPQTIIGRIPGLRRVPFNIRVTGQTTGSVANWVGQGKPKPVTSFGTNAQTLLYTKIAAIAVITEELARFSSPSAEALVRDELARAVIERMDVDFVDPAQAAVANVSPASITNGVTPGTSAGVSADNIRTDLSALLSSFIENNIDPSNLVLIMPNTLAMAASIMVNSLGQPEFPGIGIKGGTLLGIPVVASQYAANQSGSGNLVIALDASAIFIADDGQVRLDASREASVQMSDAPTNDSATGTGQSLVSMYQTNSIAIRAERYINWAKMRANSVAFIDDANWGSVGSA